MIVKGNIEPAGELKLLTEEIKALYGRTKVESKSYKLQFNKASLGLEEAIRHNLRGSLLKRSNKTKTVLSNLN